MLRNNLPEYSILGVVPIVPPIYPELGSEAESFSLIIALLPRAAWIRAVEFC